MRTALESGVDVCVGPAGSAGKDRHAMIMEGDKETGGRMGKRFQVRGEVAGAMCGGNVGGPIGGGIATSVARTNVQSYLKSQYQTCNIF